MALDATRLKTAIIDTLTTTPYGFLNTAIGGHNWFEDLITVICNEVVNEITTNAVTDEATTTTHTHVIL